MKKLFILLALVIVFIIPHHLRGFVFGQTASGPDEYIQEFAGTIAIAKDGSIRVTERIVYNFGRSVRHGIFRTIPYVKTNSQNKRYKLAIQDVSVTDERNERLLFNQSYKNDNLKVKIGDANKTITGVHTYIISYSVRGALTYFSDHDELYWNVTGNEWTVPIQRASTGFQLPTIVDPKYITLVCYTGEKGSVSKDCTASFEKDRATFQASDVLSVNQGLTIVVGFPKNIVTVLEPLPAVPFFEQIFGKIILLLIIFLMVFWYLALPFIIFYKWIKYGRDPRPPMGPSKAWFSPPTTEGGRPLLPGETGALFDETVDLRDIFATLIDLARRGYLKIIEIKKNTFRFDKTKNYLIDSDLLSFEKKLLSGLFDTSDSVFVQNLDITETITNVKKTLYNNLVSEKFFPSDPEKIRSTYGVIAFFSVFTFNPLLLIFSAFFGRHMPKKTLLGAQQAAVAFSLKRFLISQEKKLAFQAKNQMMFEKLLPYAIAFGVEKIWAERFKDINLKNPDWYERFNGGKINSVLLVNSLNHSYASVARASTPALSSSGFSSGFSGGSSGGGGGGGGGGSW